MASSLLLSLYLVATLAVFAAASSRSRQLPEQQLSSSNLKGLDLGSGSSCDDGTKLRSLLEARDKCCNDLGKHGHCVCSAAKKVFDSVTFLHLCDNYDACSAGSWGNAGDDDDAATAGGCSLDRLDRTAEQCGKVVKILKDLALVEKSSGDHDCFKEALFKLALENSHGVAEIEKLLLPPAGN